MTVGHFYSVGFGILLDRRLQFLLSQEYVYKCAIILISNTSNARIIPRKSKKDLSGPFISLEKLCDNLVAGYDQHNPLILFIKNGGDGGRSTRYVDYNEKREDYKILYLFCTILCRVHAHS